MMMKPSSLRSRQEPRRVSNAVIIGAMLLSLCVLSIVKARYCTTTTPFEDGKAAEEEQQLQEQMNSNIRMETEDDSPARTQGEQKEDEEEEEDVVSSPAPPPARVVTDGKKKKGGNQPTCYMTSKRSERCDASGDVRVDGTRATIYGSGIDREWKTKPYARYHDAVAMSTVREYVLKPLLLAGGEGAPTCTRNHSVPGFLFSNRGFSGNLYHDYTDVLVPLFISTHYEFGGGEVRFLISGMKPWWVGKFAPVLRQLSKYDVVDVDNDPDVHCFPRVVVGATFHKDLGVVPSMSPGRRVSVVDFKRVLRRAFGLQREAAASTRTKPPRLLIISRRNSRRFLNEGEMARAAAGVGFEVRVAEPDQNTDTATFARLVNAADVMVGVHGAGLTNMVFLPRGAVLVQVVPFGGLEWLTGVTFKDPAADMEVSYMDYKVTLEESSLVEQYPRDHQVLTDPYAVHKHGGWDALKSVYLDKQNIRIDLHRFNTTLQEALRRLPLSPSP